MAASQPSASDLAERLPAFFIAALESDYGAETAALILGGLGARRPTTLRVNTLISNRDEVAEGLERAGIAFETVPWYGDAFVLEDGAFRAVRETSLYAEGRVYLQSLSSMLPPLVLGAQPGEDVLDMCAAPGGKTTQIAALTSGKAYVTACEMHAPRAEKLEFNLRKLGAQNVTVMRTDARRLDSFFSFDRILIDAPCSGSGTLDVRSKGMQERFTEKLVAKSQKAQAALLQKGLELLRPGGTLVYSTCSVLRSENEGIVDAALEGAKQGSFSLEPAVIPNLDACMIPALHPEMALIAPDRLFEGFFIAKIVRYA